MRSQNANKGAAAPPRLSVAPSWLFGDDCCKPARSPAAVADLLDGKATPGPKIRKDMKRFSNIPWWLRLTAIAVLLLALLGAIVWKPLLIAYHRKAMVSIWQTELGISQPKGLVVSVREFLGLPVTRKSDPQAAGRAFSHREALLNLGYFSRHRFSLPTVIVGTPDYQKLCDKVAAQTGQTPTAQFDYDQPAAPSRVLGLIVYATPSEMPAWEQFITRFTDHHE